MFTTIFFEKKCILVLAIWPGTGRIKSVAGKNNKRRTTMAFLVILLVATVVFGLSL
jgi:hypothetical protein